VRSRIFVFALSMICLLAAAPARAELVFFSTGRVLSVKSHRMAGESLVLTLRSGAEVFCDPSIVARIEPDEVPYPEPELEVSQTQPNPGTEPAARPSAFDDIIERVAEEEGVDARLVHAVIEVESGYRPRARSPKGAMGLMQLMPATARQYAVKNPYDPLSNVRAGTRHLRSLLARFPVALALAAYNAGDAAVERFGGIPPFAETRNYVSRILKIVDPT
jgi:soluble lytic murein transglycosylase-like protein